MSRPLSLALVQATGRPSDDLDGWAGQARQVVRDFPDADLVAYPELHLGGPSGETGLDHESALALAEPIGHGTRHDTFARLAAELGVWLCPGTVLERSDDGRLFNTAVMYAPSGDLVSSYRKVFAWRPYEPYAPGDHFEVFDLEGIGRIGWSICYDAWWPETTRHLAWMGAELVLNLVKTPTVDREQELILARANAIVNQVFVASLNAAAPSGLGQSLLVDPEGRVLTSVSTAGSTVLTGLVDLDAVPMVRERGTAGLTRMWDHFQPGDAPIELPLYQGRITPETWPPRHSPDHGSCRSKRASTGHEGPQAR